MLSVGCNYPRTRNQQTLVRVDEGIVNERRECKDGRREREKRAEEQKNGNRLRAVGGPVL
jgi:hypothetical protein